MERILTNNEIADSNYQVDIAGLSEREVAENFYLCPMELIYIYHSGFVIEGSDFSLLIDYYQDTPDRFVHTKFLNRPGRLYILASHSHPDHFTPEILEWRNVRPDIQYILNKSHQEYARFGTQTLHDLLSDLIVNRINYDNDYYMKILLDEAVEIVKSLSEVHLNYLSLIFLCKEIRMNSINSIDLLKEHCEYICSKMPITNGIESSVPFLYMLRLLTISLGNADEVYAKRYNLDIGKVKEILPLAMNSIPGDYSLTPVGIIIAIINIHNKTNLNLDFKIWIKSV